MSVGVREAVLPADAVLMVIDVQRAIDAPYWGRRNNPDAEARIVFLLALWRRRGGPVIHVRHDSTFADSAYRPGQPGNDFKPDVAPLPGESVLPKRINSAFIGTDLEQRLRAAGRTTLVVTGVSTSNSVEATVRMAGNLGFTVYLVADATFTFDKRDLSGRVFPAEDVQALSLANMHGEHAQVVDSAWVAAHAV